MKFLIGIIIVGICFAVFGVGIWQASHEQVRQTYAQAALVTAQSQARVDTAQAVGIMLLAALPWGILVTVGIIGAGLFALAFAVVTRRQQPVIVYLPQEPRRMVWDRAAQLGQGQESEITQTYIDIREKV